MKERKAKESKESFPSLSVAFRSFFSLPLLLCACQGSVPTLSKRFDPNLGAVVVSCDIQTSDGHAYSGGAVINLEGVGRGSAEIYRIFLPARQVRLYPVAPGLYRVAPPRGIFGTPQKTIPITADNRSYAAAVPNYFPSAPPILVRPGTVSALGLFKAWVMPAPTGVKPEIKTFFADDPSVKRGLIEAVIHSLSGSGSEPPSEELMSWTPALENALSDLESGRSFSPSPVP